MTERNIKTAVIRREPVGIVCDADTLRLVREYARREGIALNEALGHLVRSLLTGETHGCRSVR